MNRFLIIIAFTLISSCVHKVFSLKVKDAEYENIHSAMEEVCEDSCQLKRCWLETADVIFCEIGFSFTSETHQEEVMKQIAEKVTLKEHKIAFCGRDSTGTQIAAGLITGATAGVVGAATGSSLASSSVSATYHDSEATSGKIASLDVRAVCDDANELVE